MPEQTEHTPLAAAEQHEQPEHILLAHRAEEPSDACATTPSGAPGTAPSDRSAPGSDDSSARDAADRPPRQAPGRRKADALGPRPGDEAPGEPRRRSPGRSGADTPCRPGRQAPSQAGEPASALPGRARSAPVGRVPSARLDDDPFTLPGTDPFGPHNLPMGVFTPAGSHTRRVGVRIGGHVLDAAAAATALGSPYATLLSQPSLGPLLAAGRTTWRDVRRALTGWISVPAHRAVLEPLLFPLSSVTLHLPFEVADYVDFYSSEHHARNLGQILRPGTEPLTANWKHLPIGYHGRSGTVVVSGTDVARPLGQRRAADGEGAPVFGPSARLDFEAEVAFVVGVPSEHGRPVPLTDFRRHVFGLCLLNDWSARDIQGWENVPLGPFLGKSFATSLSAWITPLEALDAARVTPPERTHALLPYLDDSADRPKDALRPNGAGTGEEREPGGYDLRLSVAINGRVVSQPRFSHMYWTPAQQLAHMTVNGASLRTGDLYASGTVSGPARDQYGSLIELTWNGRDPLVLPDGSRAFLEDGDEVTLTGWAPGPDGTRVGLGEVRGRITPAGQGS